MPSLRRRGGNGERRSRAHGVARSHWRVLYHIRRDEIMARTKSNCRARCRGGCRSFPLIIICGQGRGSPNCRGVWPSAPITHVFQNGTCDLNCRGPPATPTHAQRQAYTVEHIQKGPTLLTLRFFKAQPRRNYQVRRGRSRTRLRGCRGQYIKFAKGLARAAPQPSQTQLSEVAIHLMCS